MSNKEIQGRAKQTRHIVEIPNLVELQLNSYRWFLEEGMQELFNSFSPIYDFTGNTSISLTDFTLGEPKYSVEECRDRDMTFESPIKAKVLLKQANKEEIESEVYLGDLPLMTDKGTFIINGAERVVVSQLARSPGVYFKDSLDFSGKVLFFATIIPQEGAWVDVETDNGNLVTVRIGQTKKFPLTTLLRALRRVSPGDRPVGNADQRPCWNVSGSTRTWKFTTRMASWQAQRYRKISLSPTACSSLSSIKRPARSWPKNDTVATEAFLTELADKVGANTVIKLYSRTESTQDILDMFSTRATLEEPHVGAAAAKASLLKTSRAMARRFLSGRIS